MKIAGAFAPAISVAVTKPDPQHQTMPSPDDAIHYRAVTLQNHAKP